MASRTPRFRISLDTSTQKVYSAGDKITGRVCFSSQKEHTIGRVIIKFSGRCKTRIHHHDGHGTKTYRGRAMLFSRELLLHNARLTKKPCNLEWPFEFTFPETAEPTAAGDTWKDSDASFLDSRQHALIDLPSSMETEAKPATDHNFECWIQYHLAAYVFAPNAVNPGREAKVRLPFAQHMRSDSRIPDSPPISKQETFKVRSYKLAPENQSLSIKQKAKMALGYGEIPSAEFTVIVETPAFLYTGKGNSIHIKLKPPNTELNEALPESVPTIILKSLRFKLVAGTSARSARRNILMFDSQGEEEIFCDTGLRENRAPWSRSFTKEENLAMSLSLDNLNLIGLVPSFVTANISRRYMLKMVFLLECAGKEFTMEHGHRVDVLPARKSQLNFALQAMPRPASISEDSEVSDSILEETDDLPPPYQEQSENFATHTVAQTVEGS